jgi:hypothetical protein
VKADGSVVQAADINPGSEWSNPRGFVEFQNELYFGANSTGDIWKVQSDGSVVQVDDGNPAVDLSFGSAAVFDPDGLFV